jgi:hypothetical protein
MMTIDDAIAFFIAHKQAKITQNYNHYKMLFGICAIRTILLYTFRWRSTTYKTRFIPGKRRNKDKALFVLMSLQRIIAFS